MILYNNISRNLCKSKEQSESKRRSNYVYSMHRSGIYPDPVQSRFPGELAGRVSFPFPFLHILLLWVNTRPKGVIIVDGKELAKQTLDQIPRPDSNAKRIVGLVKEGGKITGYQLSDNSIVEKQQAVDMAKQGQIAGVGIAHRCNTEYLKSIPDSSENNNLGNLPSVSPDTQG